MSLTNIDNKKFDLIFVRRVQFFNVLCTGRKGRSCVAGHYQAHGLFAAKGRQRDGIGLVNNTDRIPIGGCLEMQPWQIEIGWKPAEHNLGISISRRPYRLTTDMVD
jgi:hypothetical protein